MTSRRPGLLNHSESLRPPQLLFCKQAAPRTYLESTLAKAYQNKELGLPLESTLNTYKEHRGRTSHLLSIADPSLCFLTLTKFKFIKSFVFVSIQNAVRAPPPRSPLSYN